MMLADELKALRDRTLADLAAAYDYYADAMTAWMIVHQHVAAGFMLNNKNAVTGTVTSHDQLVAKSRGYMAEQLVEATFQQFIAIFEGFYFELLRL